jgi:DNA repair protein RecO (recombination protein O)
MLKKDEAVCIRTVDYSETSQIVTFFGRMAGKIRAIAKGSKRPKSPFGGPIEMFSYGPIVFTESRGQRLSVLTEFEQRNIFGGLRSNLFALNGAYLAVELLGSLTTDSDPHPQLFDSFVQFLQNSGQASDRAGLLARLVPFQLDLLREVGTFPVLDHCINCKRAFNNEWGEVYFSSSLNGLVCRDCEASFVDKVKISPKSAVCLNDLKHIDSADEKTLAEIEKALIYHFTEILNHPPRTAKYVLSS